MHRAEAEGRFDRLINRRSSDSLKWNSFPHGILPMWVADMDFMSPPAVVHALKQRAEHGVFGYPTEPPALRELVVDRVFHRYGWQVDPQDILFFPSVVYGANLAALAVLSKGQRVLLQPPVYHRLLDIPANVGAKASYAELVQLDGGSYAVDTRDFRKQSRHAKLFLLCNPHNPVGRVYTRGELEGIADACLQRRIVICSDEVHADFVYDDRPHVPVASLDRAIAQQSVTIFAANKTFNTPGLGCATAIVPNAKLRERMLAARRGLVSQVSVMGYVATIAAYRHGDAWAAELSRYLDGNRGFLRLFVATHLPGITVSPVEGTYLAWLDCRRLVIQGSPAEYFLRQAKVAVVDGKTFGPGGEGFVRLNFGCPRDTLREALERMREAVGALG